MGTKVAVLGIWHLGSVYSACLADLGYNVVGWDSDTEKVKNLNSGLPPLFEPGLEELVSVNIAAQRLAYTADLAQALKGASYALLTFDTPVNDQDEVDLTAIYETAFNLAPYLENDAVVIVSSQVPIGTCKRIKSLIQEGNPALVFDIAYVPENLRLGQAIENFKNPDRVVIGADSAPTLDRVEEFFAVVPGPKVRMELESAEMVKHALNSFLGLCISFGNEIANLCDELGADALKVASALKMDKRIGGAPILPGLGFAGGTLARDLKVLQSLGDRLGYESHMVDAILKVNAEQNRRVAIKLQRALGSLEGSTIGVLGLTYKPGTSTLRRSAALEIIRELIELKARVKAYDPKADRDEVWGHREFQFCTDPYAVAEGCDALVVITDWPEFRELDFARLKAAMRRPILIDAQNMLNGEELARMGFSYSGMGRGSRGEAT